MNFIEQSPLSSNENRQKQPKPHPLKNRMDIIPDDSHGYTGLANIGNTCFLNSCIQIINNIYELTPIYETVFNKYKKNDIPDTFFFQEWIDLHILLWKKDGLISPARFVQIVHRLSAIKNRDLFTGFSQNDIHEFIHLFIETLHTSISRKIDIVIAGTPENELDELAIKCYSYLQKVYKNEYSEILNLFYGISVSKIIGLNQNVHSTVPENFFILDLPIPQIEVFNNTPLQLPFFSQNVADMNSQNRVHSLYDCFDLFTKEEIMDGDNSWFNESTGEKETIIKKTEFWNFPEILVVSLKRFSACGRWKRNDLVDFPLKSLDLSRYVCGYNPQNYKYDLFGVCNHSGGCEGGHYTAFVLNYLDEWIHYNDGFVEKIGTDERNEIDVKNIVTTEAYCLFYRIIR